MGAMTARATQAIPATLHALRVPIDQLRHYQRNPRRGDTALIRQSLERHGQYRPVVANQRTSEVLAGNHTLAAARELGWVELAVTWVDVDEEQAARIALIDNRASDLASYDNRELADLLASLQGDYEATGWDGADLDLLLAQLSDDANPPEPLHEVPVEPRTQPGDLWQCGPHRVLCGDCRDPADVARLVGDQQVHVAITSPPYAEQRAYDETSGFKPVPPAEYVDWFAPAAANIAAHLAEDGSWFLNIKPGVSRDGLDTELYVVELVLAHVRDWGWHFATEFCWERIGVPKHVIRRFKNQFEPVYQFTRGDWKFRPDAVRHWSEMVPVNGGPGSGATTWSGAQGSEGTGSREWRIARKHPAALKKVKGTSGTMAKIQGIPSAPSTAGEYQTEGFAYPGNRIPPLSGSHQATGHAAAFPVGLPEFFIKAYSDRGDVVLDPFAGSGSTLIAAHQVERRGLMLEISPAYCDVIVDRWEQASGKKARRRGKA